MLVYVLIDLIHVKRIVNLHVFDFETVEANAHVNRV